MVFERYGCATAKVNIDSIFLKFLLIEKKKTDIFQIIIS